MTAELSINNQFHSPAASLDGAALGVNSPSSGSRRQSLPSPWAQVVRGETETTTTAEQTSIASTGLSSISCPAASPVPAAADAADESQVVSSDGGNAGGTKKVVWKKPLNGAGTADTSPVMGAESWPALSESTRPVPKLSSESFSKPVIDASISFPLPQGPVISHTPHKQDKPNANANTNHSHGHPVRQRSMKRSSGGTGGGGGSAGFTRAPQPPTPPPLPPPFPMFEIPYGNLVPAVLDAPVREGPYKGNSNWVARPMGHGVNDHSSHRNPSRRGNFGGGRPRGDGPYANGYGGRHEQDRDWLGPRGSNARDVHMPHQMVPPPHGPRGVIRPPHPGGPPFIAPQAMRPFGNPMGFDMASPFLYVPALPPEPFRGAPLIPHATPMFFPVMDPPLPTLILNQIEYYFSEANLVKDNYLRSNMDDEAWVPVTLIANFPRVQSLTNDIQLILDSLRTSTVVEVQGDKVRPRKQWKKWATTSDRFPADSGVQSPRGGASDSSLPTSFQKLTVDEATTKLKSTLGSTDADTKNVAGFSSGGESTDQSKFANGEVIAEACSSHI